MARRGGPSTPSPRSRSKIALLQDKKMRSRCDANEVENAKRLDKLPQELWGKIFDDIDENDLFPMALSCRFFRQKQKELVGGEWTRQSGDETSKPHLALRTRLIDKKGGNIPERGQPLSVEYLRFCYKDAISRDVREKRADCVRCLAAFYGHLPLLQEFLEPWGLYDPLERFDSAIAFARYAAWGGQLETLQWLKYTFRIELDSWVFARACHGGNIEIVEWLGKEDCPWKYSSISQKRALDGAVKGGHLEVLKWLRGKGCPWGEGTCLAAAREGHRDVLKYLHENGCPWDEVACQKAARYGHLDVLKYLHESGCPWDKRSFRIAAVYGHLDVLKYLHYNGCPWDEFTWRAAAKSTRKWLNENGSPQGKRENSVIRIHQIDVDLSTFSLH